MDLPPGTAVALGEFNTEFVRKAFAREDAQAQVQEAEVFQSDVVAQLTRDGWLG